VFPPSKLKSWAVLPPTADLQVWIMEVLEQHGVSMFDKSERGAARPQIAVIGPQLTALMIAIGLLFVWVRAGTLIDVILCKFFDLLPASASRGS
jgi:hypothetical protein